MKEPTSLILPMMRTTLCQVATVTSSHFSLFPAWPLPPTPSSATVSRSLRNKDGKLSSPSQPDAKVNSPSLLSRGDSGNFLGAPIDTGLDDFAAELGWMVDVIGSKAN
ncbi:hypothetical protein NW765_000326 [Fusarium oxysporum]|nr:hypothetical protein NW765_000326 [Fusarium oxysporum]